MIVAISDPGSGYGEQIASGLAALHACCGRKVLVLDAGRHHAGSTDSTGSAIGGGARSRPKLPVRPVSANGLSRDLDRLLPHYDDVVIGADSADTPDARAALIAARLAIVPLRPDHVDMARDYQLIARLSAARMFLHGSATAGHDSRAGRRAFEQMPAARGEMEALYQELVTR